MSTIQTVRRRNRLKRVFGWTLFYICVFTLFLAFVYWQSSKVSTYGLPTGQIQLTTSKTTYTAGDTVSYAIHNGLISPITLISSCAQEPLYVYQWENSKWVRIHDTADVKPCNTPANTTIAPNTSLSGDYAKWPQLFSKPGIYRLVVLANNYEGLPYADFTVTSKPQPPTPPPAPTIIYQPIYIPVPTSGGGGGDD